MSAAPIPYSPELQLSSSKVDEWMSAIGRELSAIREEKAISQKDMAASLDVSRSTLIRLESGESPNMPKYIEYALELGVNPAVLVARANGVLKARRIDLSSIE